MLKEPLGFLSKENKELEELIKRQTNEITKTQVRLATVWNVLADIHHLANIWYLAINVSADSN